jgi:hypothetical protein
MIVILRDVAAVCGIGIAPVVSGNEYPGVHGIR